MLTITVAQLNYTVGDIEGNARKMIAAAQQAALAGAELVVFSELGLTGYYPADLLEEPGFMEDAAQAAQITGDTAERQLAQAYLALAVYPLGRNTQSETLIAQLRDPAQPPLSDVARRVMLMADANQRFRRGEHAELPGVIKEVIDSLEAGASLYDWWECVPANSWATVRGMTHRPVPPQRR